MPGALLGDDLGISLLYRRVVLGSVRGRPRHPGVRWSLVEVTGSAGDARAAGPPRGGNPLQALIQARKDELGLSFSQLATKAGLPRSTVYYLSATPVLQRSPSATTLERLAVALELPVQTVRSAAAEALGLNVYVHENDASRADLAVLMASVEQLDAQDREHVAALVRSLLRRRRGDDDQPASGDSPGPG